LNLGLSFKVGYQKYSNMLPKLLGFAPTRPLLALLITMILQVLFAILAGAFGDALLVSKLLACGVALAALYGLGKLEGRSLASFGFRGNVPRSLGLGLLGGFGLIAIVVGLMALTGLYQILEFRFSLEFLGWVLVLIPASIAEEILYRGILFRMSEEGWGTIPALAFSSLIFGLIHATNPGATPLTSLAIGLEGGVLLGAVYVLTRNIWVAVGLHLGWNLASSVFGFSVSGVRNPGLFQSQVSGADLWNGGKFGPEAGLITLLVATIAGTGILMYAFQKAQLRQAGAARETISSMPS
jgi:uncharacterized protein